MNRTTTKDSAGTRSGGHVGPVRLLRRVDSKTVEVTVHFSGTSNETMADIVRRMIEREVEKSA